jgi:uncharacterized membrane protein
MRYGFAAVGAVLGYGLGSQSSALWGLVVGAVVGFGWGELKRLRFELSQLKREIGNRGSQTPSSAVRSPPPFPEPESIEEPPPEAWLDEPAPAPTPAAASVAAVPSTSTPTGTRSFDPYNSAPAAASPPRPRAESQPAAEIPLFTWIRGFFTGGNTLVRAGIVVLFFGVAFLLRYAAEHSHVPIEFRLSGVALGAVALLVLGWRLRRRREGYALALQGGGIGILYLTTFAALRLYNVVPPAVAFPLLVLIALLSAALAVLQDSLAFALLGVIGGFLAPILASSGQGSHVVLFSYFLVLNAGIVVIAWYKSWRPLNVCGFVFTFTIATAWGVLKYRSEDFASTEPFLIAFFLFYLGIAVLFALRQPLELRGYVDGALVFGTPIAAFGLQTALLRHDSMGLAYSAVFLCATYLLLAFALRRRGDPKQQLLIESFLTLGVVFLTLAIPLALGNRMNSAAWALEGAGLIWIGCRQGRRMARALGALLEIAAAGLLLNETHGEFYHWLLPMGSYPGVVLVGVACLFSSGVISRTMPRLNELEILYAPLLFGVGLFTWCFGGLGELPHWISGNGLLSAGLIFLALTALILSELARRRVLDYAAGASLLLLPAMYIVFGLYAVNVDHPFAVAGWLAWPVSFAAFYLAAARHEGAAPSALGTWLHTFSAWLLCGVAGWELSWAVGKLIGIDDSDWGEVSEMVIPAVILLALPELTARVRWPFALHRRAYAARAGAGLALVLALWMLTVNTHRDGNSLPLPYLPLLSPLDAVQALVLLALMRYRHLARDTSLSPAKDWNTISAAVLAALGFVWFNGMLLRSLHHFMGVPYTWPALAASNVVQTALSISWSVLALITMLVASRRHMRPAWIAGAGLLVAVVIKLFFVDLSSIGSIPRIISFLGVGLLMLIIGYFSPLPPRALERA